LYLRNFLVEVKNRIKGSKLPWKYRILHLASRNSKKTGQPNLSKNKEKYSRKGAVHICVTLSMGIYGLKLSKGQEHGKMEFPSPPACSNPFLSILTAAIITY
jgi:hypothetical protein